MNKLEPFKFWPGLAARAINVAVAIKSDPEAAAALLSDQPLPDRDVSLDSVQLEFGNGASSAAAQLLSQTLVLEANADAHLGLGSYLDWEKAVDVVAPEAAKLKAARPTSGDHRFTVLSAIWRQSVSGGIRHIPLAGLASSFTAKATGGGRVAVISAVERNAPAREQLGAVFSGWTLPFGIRTQNDLAPHQAVVFGFEGELQLRAETGFQFDVNWVRKPSGARPGRDLGLKVRGPANASLDYGLAGSFVAVIVREGDRLRLRIARQKQRGVGFAAQIHVSAEIPKPVAPESHDELTRAMTGLHESQWIRHIAEPPTARFAKGTEAFRAAWAELPPGVHDLLWEAAGEESQLEGFGQWIDQAKSQLLDSGNAMAEISAILGSDDEFLASRTGQALERYLRELRDRLSRDTYIATLLRVLPAARKLISDQVLRGALLALRKAARHQLDDRKILRAFSSLASYRKVPAPVRAALEDLLFPIKEEADLRHLRGVVQNAGQLRDRLYVAAQDALAQRLRFELAYRYQSLESEDALVDCSFAFTDEGIALYQEALSGDFRRLFAAPEEHVIFHSALLTHRFEKKSRLDLHLPFVDRKQWVAALDSQASLEIKVDEGGRIFVYDLRTSSQIQVNDSYKSLLAVSGDVFVRSQQYDAGFRLTYVDEQTLRGGRLAVQLNPVLDAYLFDPAARARLQALAMPDETALWRSRFTVSAAAEHLAAWIDAPGPKSKNYFPVYSGVSIRVQQALRRWLPMVYFADPSRYADLAAALPLVVWSQSAPCPGDNQRSLTYDMMSKDHLELLLATAHTGLARHLKTIGGFLNGQGLEDAARYYLNANPRQVISEQLHSPRLLKALMAADAGLVQSIVDLAVSGNRSRALLTSDPSSAVRELNKFSTAFVKTFHSRLRRLYGGHQFLAFGPLLMAEATSALNEALGRPAPLMASLELTPAGSSEALSHILLNPAYRT